ncbi:MAG TPA: aldehyde dehydrogenase family protein, partial [Burkholderiaceae bacterium]|nr:aldehyde dehydrogenase family protein [Burkholderiaceae bacterium]
MSALPVHSATPLDLVRSELNTTLKLQRAAYFAHPVPSLDERKADLLKLKTFLRENKQGIIEAINADYGNRSTHETLLTEIVPAMGEVDHALKHLKKWMKPQRRHVDLMNYFGARNRVIPQPLGVVGCIVPWNFPVNLTFAPLVSIFSAGNRAMVKMSENSRHLCQFLIEKIPAYFPKDKLAFFDETGGVGIEFSKLKFDHLLFTGSGTTGRAVMAAAAQNLCPVTLELGGKAPAIVCDDFHLRTAAERLMFVKCLNAGQICTTIDYLFLPKGKTAAFTAMAKQIVQARYPSIASADLTSIIDERSFNRLTAA